MMRNALVAGLTVALLGINASAVQAQKPGDGCSLLQGAEVQALAGSTKAGTGKPSTDPLGSRLCHYERVETTALVKGNMLIVTFDSSDARAKKDQVIALLKAAASRL